MNIVPRHVWCSVKGAKVGEIRTPSHRLWLHHGAAGVSDVATACGYVRYHIRTHGWKDVGYSFLIAEGKVLEGRGAGRAGAHTQGDNHGSHGICMVGNYESRLPSTRDVDALVWLVRHGMERGWWVGPLTGGHRDAPGARTPCPGTRLWKHIPDINRQIAEQGDDMGARHEQMIEAIYEEVFVAKDSKVPQGGTGRTLRDRVFQNNEVLGQLDGLTPQSVAAEVVRALPAGTISAKAVADTVIDVLHARTRPKA